MTERFSPETLKAIAKLQAFEKTAAFQRVGAFVVLPPSGTSYGKIKVSFPADGAGKLQLWLWDCAGADIQYATATGGNYDKVQAALSKLTFDGLPIEDGGQSWETQLENRGYKVIRAF